MNFCYDVPVKLFSTRLLVMAVFVVAPQAVRLFNLFFLNFAVAPMPRPPWRLGPALLRRTAPLARPMFICYLLLMPLWSNYQLLKSFNGPTSTKAWAGYYRAESFTRDEMADRALPDNLRWVKVGINSMGIGVVMLADGSSRRQFMKFDEAKGTVTI